MLDIEFNRDVLGILYWRSLADPSIQCTTTVMTYEHILDRIGYPPIKSFPKEIPVIVKSDALPEVLTALWLNYGVYYEVANKLFGGKLGELKLLNLVLSSDTDSNLVKQAVSIFTKVGIDKLVSYKPYLPKHKHKHKRSFL